MARKFHNIFVLHGATSDAQIHIFTYTLYILLHGATSAWGGTLDAQIKCSHTTYAGNGNRVNRDRGLVEFASYAVL